MRRENQDRLDEILDAVRRSQANAREVERDAAEVTVTVTTDNRELTVTMNGLGKLKGVKVDPDALATVTAEELGVLIHDAVRAAQQAASDYLRRRRVRAGARSADLDAAARSQTTVGR